MQLMLLVLASCAVGGLSVRCGKDEQYYECTPSCKNNCRAYNNPGIRCGCGPPGCFCKEGLVKRTSDGKCVKPHQCPGGTKCTGANEEMKECAKPKWCNTCGIRGNCKLSDCPKGCDCKDGFYRDDSGVCIPQEQCPGNGGGDECAADEQYYECKPGCQSTCFALTSPFKIACRMPCQAGCYCKEGLYKTDDGQCVTPDECPTPEDATCGDDDEEYNRCGSACPPTCTNGEEPGPCTEQCVPGCYCKSGLVRDESSGKCVKLNECQLVCGVNEEIKDCALPKGCNTCKNPNGITCKFVCQRGCDCLTDYHRNDNGVCIPQAQC